MTYNWQQKDWLQFRHNEGDFTEISLRFMSLVGECQGIMQGLSGNDQSKTMLAILVKEAIKTSAIEGEI
jgi:hypothetical protein